MDFLRFAEVTFTSKMADPKHNHSFNSYLLRIPHTFNSKCINKAKNPEVKIIQKFDPQNTQQIGINLLHEFRLYLADLELKNKRDYIKQEKRIRIYNKSNNYQSTTQISQSYQWIEILLQTAVLDHRKFSIELVLAPYLINARCILFDQAYSIIHDWITKCDNLRRLDPPINNF
jgi:hypothetical protein